jgi:hypothetical protein
MRKRIGNIAVLLLHGFLQFFASDPPESNKTLGMRIVRALATPATRSVSGSLSLPTVQSFWARTVLATFATLVTACVPSGTAPPWDGGTRAQGKPVVQAADILTQVFEDSFDDRKDVALDAGALDAGTTLTAVAPRSDAGVVSLSDAGRAMPMLLADGGRTPSVSVPGVPGIPSLLAALDAGKGVDAALPGLMPSLSPFPSAPQPAVAIDAPSDLGPHWRQAKTSAWKIENGKLCGKGARNHGVWLTRPIPINARIEFDAIASSAAGDLKAEVWGDGQSSATSVSYTNATSYLSILGGWENTVHVLARINEHGPDRKEIKVDKESDDARQHPVSVGQAYRFKIERSDGKTVRVSVNGIEYFSWVDAEPLAGIGHDHFGFNNWEVRTCFDNVKVTPL